MVNVIVFIILFPVYFIGVGILYLLGRIALHYHGKGAIYEKFSKEFFTTFFFFLIYLIALILAGMFLVPIIGIFTAFSFVGSENLPDVVAMATPLFLSILAFFLCRQIDRAITHRLTSNH